MQQNKICTLKRDNGKCWSLQKRVKTENEKNLFSTEIFYSIVVSIQHTQNKKFIFGEIETDIERDRE